VQRHRDPEHPAGDHRRHRSEAAKTHHDIGPHLPHRTQAENEAADLRRDEPHQAQRVPREAGAGHGHKIEMRILFDETRIHSFLADKKDDRVAAHRQPLGERNARGQMPARAAAGDDDFFVHVNLHQSHFLV
jgi:hypothetical protein